MVLALGPWQILKRQQRRFVEHHAVRLVPAASHRLARSPRVLYAARRAAGQPAAIRDSRGTSLHGQSPAAAGVSTEHRRSASWQVGGECKSAVAIAHFDRTTTKESHAAVEPARARGARPDPAAFPRALGTADTLGTTYLPRLAVLRGLFKIRARARLVRPRLQVSSCTGGHVSRT